MTGLQFICTSEEYTILLRQLIHHGRSSKAGANIWFPGAIQGGKADTHTRGTAAPLYRIQLSEYAFCIFIKYGSMSDLMQEQIMALLVCWQVDVHVGAFAEQVSKLKERVRYLEDELEYYSRNQPISHQKAHKIPEYLSQERGDGSRQSVAEGTDEFNLAERLLRQSPGSRGTKQTDNGEEDLVCIPRATLELLYLKEKAMDAVKEGITIADARLPDMPLIYINEGFSRMTGYPTSFVMNKNCRFLQGESTDPNEVAKLRKAVKNGEACTVQIAVRWSILMICKFILADSIYLFRKNYIYMCV